MSHLSTETYFPLLRNILEICIENVYCTFSKPDILVSNIPIGLSNTGIILRLLSLMFNSFFNEWIYQHINEWMNK